MEDKEGRTLTDRPGSGIATLPRPPAEQAIRAKIEAGQLITAAADTGRLYGAEVFGFLVGVLDSHQARGEVYARVLQLVALEIGRFEWRCSLRAWVYTRARRELARYREHADRRGACDSLQPVAFPALTTAAECRRGGPPGTLAALRGEMAPLDRELLILRIDRRFGWLDLAFTSLGDDASFGELMTESYRLRDQFERIRQQIFRAAVHRRLLEPR